MVGTLGLMHDKREGSLKLVIWKDGKAFGGYWKIPQMQFC